MIVEKLDFTERIDSVTFNAYARESSPYPKELPDFAGLHWTDLVQWLSESVGVLAKEIPVGEIIDITVVLKGGEKRSVQFHNGPPSIEAVYGPGLLYRGQHGVIYTTSMGSLLPGAVISGGMDIAGGASAVGSAAAAASSTSPTVQPRAPEVTSVQFDQIIQKEGVAKLPSLRSVGAGRGLLDYFSTGGESSAGHDKTEQINLTGKLELDFNRTAMSKRLDFPLQKAHQSVKFTTSDGSTIIPEYDGSNIIVAFFYELNAYFIYALDTLYLLKPIQSSLALTTTAAAALSATLSDSFRGVKILALHVHNSCGLLKFCFRENFKNIQMLNGLDLKHAEESSTLLTNLEYYGHEVGTQLFVVKNSVGNVIGKVVKGTGRVVNDAGEVIGHVVGEFGLVVDATGKLLGKVYTGAGRIRHDIIGGLSGLSELTVFDSAGRQIGTVVDHTGKVLNHAGQAIGNVATSTGQVVSKTGKFLGSLPGKGVEKLGIIKSKAEDMFHIKSLVLHPEKEYEFSGSLTLPEMPRVPSFHAPELPDVKMPELLPEMPDVKFPELPDLPAMPKVDLPEMPSMPEMPKMDMPSMPEMPKMEIPSMPELPKMEMPSMPELPKVDLPSVPKMPEMHMPSMPEMPSMPDLTSIPELPKVDLPNMPQLPDLPSVVPEFELPKPHFSKIKLPELPDLPVSLNWNDIDVSSSLYTQVKDAGGQIVGHVIDTAGHVVDQSGNLLGKVNDEAGHVVDHFGRYLGEMQFKINIEVTREREILLPQLPAIGSSTDHSRHDVKEFASSFSDWLMSGYETVTGKFARNNKHELAHEIHEKEHELLLPVPIRKHTDYTKEGTRLEHGSEHKIDRSLSQKIENDFPQEWFRAESNCLPVRNIEKTYGRIERSYLNRGSVHLHVSDFKDLVTSKVKPGAVLYGVMNEERKLFWWAFTRQGGEFLSGIADQNGLEKLKEQYGSELILSDSDLSASYLISEKVRNLEVNPILNVLRSRSTPDAKIKIEKNWSGQKIENAIERDWNNGLLMQRSYTDENDFKNGAVDSDFLLRKQTTPWEFRSGAEKLRFDSLGKPGRIGLPENSENPLKTTLSPSAVDFRATFEQEFLKRQSGSFGNEDDPIMKQLKQLLAEDLEKANQSMKRLATVRPADVPSIGQKVYGDLGNFVSRFRQMLNGPGWSLQGKKIGGGEYSGSVTLSVPTLPGFGEILRVTDGTGRKVKAIPEIVKLTESAMVLEPIPEHTELFQNINVTGEVIHTLKRVDTGKVISEEIVGKVLRNPSQIGTKIVRAVTGSTSTSEDMKMTTSDIPDQSASAMSSLVRSSTTDNDNVVEMMANTTYDRTSSNNVFTAVQPQKMDSLSRTLTAPGKKVLSHGSNTVMFKAEGTVTSGQNTSTTAVVEPQPAKYFAVNQDDGKVFFPKTQSRSAVPATGATSAEGSSASIELSFAENFFHDTNEIANQVQKLIRDEADHLQQIAEANYVTVKDASGHALQTLPVVVEVTKETLEETVSDMARIAQLGKTEFLSAGNEILTNVNNEVSRTGKNIGQLVDATQKTAANYALTNDTLNQLTTEAQQLEQQLENFIRQPSLKRRFQGNQLIHYMTDSAGNVIENSQKVIGEVAEEQMRNLEQLGNLSQTADLNSSFIITLKDEASNTLNYVVNKATGEILEDSKWLASKAPTSDVFEYLVDIKLFTDEDLLSIFNRLVRSANHQAKTVVDASGQMVHQLVDKTGRVVSGSQRIVGTVKSTYDLAKHAEEAALGKLYAYGEELFIANKHKCGEQVATFIPKSSPSTAGEIPALERLAGVGLDGLAGLKAGAVAAADAAGSLTHYVVEFNGTIAHYVTDGAGRVVYGTEQLTEAVASDLQNRFTHLIHDDLGNVTLVLKDVSGQIITGTEKSIGNLKYELVETLEKSNLKLHEIVSLTGEKMQVLVDSTGSVVSSTNHALHDFYDHTVKDLASAMVKHAKSAVHRTGALTQDLAQLLVNVLNGGVDLLKFALDGAVSIIRMPYDGFVYFFSGSVEFVRSWFYENVVLSKPVKRVLVFIFPGLDEEWSLTISGERRNKVLEVVEQGAATTTAATKAGTTGTSKTSKGLYGQLIHSEHLQNQDHYNPYEHEYTGTAGQRPYSTASLRTRRAPEVDGLFGKDFLQRVSKQVDKAFRNFFQTLLDFLKQSGMLVWNVVKNCYQLVAYPVKVVYRAVADQVTIVSTRVKQATARSSGAAAMRPGKGNKSVEELLKYEEGDFVKRSNRTGAASTATVTASATARTAGGPPPTGTSSSTSLATSASSAVNSFGTIVIQTFNGFYEFTITKTVEFVRITKKLRDQTIKQLTGYQNPDQLLKALQDNDNVGLLIGTPLILLFAHDCYFRWIRANPKNCLRADRKIWFLPELLRQFRNYYVFNYGRTDTESFKLAVRAAFDEATEEKFPEFIVHGAPSQHQSQRVTTLYVPLPYPMRHLVLTEDPECLDFVENKNKENWQFADVPEKDLAAALLFDRDNKNSTANYTPGFAQEQKILIEKYKNEIVNEYILGVFQKQANKFVDVLLSQSRAVNFGNENNNANANKKLIGNGTEPVSTWTDRMLKNAEDKSGRVLPSTASTIWRPLASSVGYRGSSERQDSSEILLQRDSNVDELTLRYSLDRSSSSTADKKARQTTNIKTGAGPRPTTFADSKIDRDSGYNFEPESTAGFYGVEYGRATAFLPRAGRGTQRSSAAAEDGLERISEENEPISGVQNTSTRQTNIKLEPNSNFSFGPQNPNFALQSGNMSTQSLSSSGGSSDKNATSSRQSSQYVQAGQQPLVQRQPFSLRSYVLSGVYDVSEFFQALWAIFRDVIRAVANYLTGSTSATGILTGGSSARSRSQLLTVTSSGTTTQAQSHRRNSSSVSVFSDVFSENAGFVRQVAEIPVAVVTIVGRISLNSFNSLFSLVRDDGTSATRYTRTMENIPKNDNATVSINRYRTNNENLLPARGMNNARINQDLPQSPLAREMMTLYANNLSRFYSSNALNSSGNKHSERATRGDETEFLGSSQLLGSMFSPASSREQTGILSSPGERPRSTRSTEFAPILEEPFGGLGTNANADKNISAGQAAKRGTSSNKVAIKATTAAARTSTVAAAASSGTTPSTGKGNKRATVAAIPTTAAAQRERSAPPKMLAVRSKTGPGQLQGPRSLSKPVTGTIPVKKQDSKETKTVAVLGTTATEAGTSSSASDPRRIRVKAKVNVKVRSPSDNSASPTPDRIRMQVNARVRPKSQSGVGGGAAATTLSSTASVNANDAPANDARSSKNSTTDVGIIADNTNKARSSTNSSRAPSATRISGTQPALFYRESSKNPSWFETSSKISGGSSKASLLSSVEQRGRSMNSGASVRNEVHAPPSENDVPSHRGPGGFLFYGEREQDEEDNADIEIDISQSPMNIATRNNMNNIPLAVQMNLPEELMFGGTTTSGASPFNLVDSIDSASFGTSTQGPTTLDIDVTPPWTFDTLLQDENDDKFLAIFYDENKNVSRTPKVVVSSTKRLAKPEGEATAGTVRVKATGKVTARTAAAPPLSAGNLKTTSRPLKQDSVGSGSSGSDKKTNVFGVLSTQQNEKNDPTKNRYDALRSASTFSNADDVLRRNSSRRESENVGYNMEGTSLNTSDSPQAAPSTTTAPLSTSKKPLNSASGGTGTNRVSFQRDYLTAENINKQSPRGQQEPTAKAASQATVAAPAPSSTKKNTSTAKTKSKKALKNLGSIYITEKNNYPQSTNSSQQLVSGKITPNVDMDFQLHKYTLSTMAEVTYGNEQADTLLHATTTSYHPLLYKFAGLGNVVKDPNNVRKFIRYNTQLPGLIGDLRAYSTSIVNDRILELSELTRRQTNASSDFLTLILKDCLSVEAMDRRIVTDFCLSLLASEYEIVAHILQYSLFELSKHPHVLQKLRQELDATPLTAGNLLGTTSGKLNHKLPFLNNVILETIRLHPMPKTDERRVTVFESEVLPDGTFFPHTDNENNCLLYCTSSANIATWKYGNDAQSFVPERWFYVQEIPKELPVPTLLTLCHVKICLATLVSKLDFVSTAATTGIFTSRKVKKHLFMVGERGSMGVFARESLFSSSRNSISTAPATSAPEISAQPAGPNPGGKKAGKNITSTASSKTATTSTKKGAGVASRMSSTSSDSDYIVYAHGVDRMDANSHMSGLMSASNQTENRETVGTWFRQQGSSFRNYVSMNSARFLRACSFDFF
ncbi:unnamed protein product [Amoebophrya sp. A120]|nr:unnamed protein product [Amoebophrya sp. A120]|eukprot:GSA120T00019865001.1